MTVDIVGGLMQNARDNRHIAQVDIALGMLAEMLYMPPGMEILCTVTDPERSVVTLTIRHPGYPEVEDGWTIPKVIPTFTTETRVFTVDADWDTA